MELITIRIFDNLIEAQIMKSRFESEDIPCFLFDENIIGLNPLYNITIGGIKLKINESDSEKARKILGEYNNSKIINEQGEIFLCPNCKAAEFYKGYKSMKGPKGIFSAIISLVLMVFPLYYKTVNKCKVCDFEVEL